MSDSYAARVPWLPRPLPSQSFGPVAAAALAVVKTVLIVALAFALPSLFAGLVGIDKFAHAFGRDPILALLAVLFLTQLLLVLGGCLLASRSPRGIYEHMALGPPRQGVRAYVYAIIAVLAVVAVINLVRIHVFGDDVFVDLRQMAQMFRDTWWLPTFIVLAIGAPIAEEVLFRGYLLGAFDRSRTFFIVGALLSTGIWAILHSYSAGGMILVAVLGLTMAYFRYATGSLRVPLLVHALNNAVAFSLLFFLPGM